MPHSTVSFESGCLRLDLYPDSRGYVLFSMSKKPGIGEHTASLPTSIVRLTCEYLTDVIQVTVDAVRWIEKNCDQITCEGRHLYYKFREEPNATIQVEAEAVPREKPPVL